ncbi:13005_t:CDS:10 [Rhizophagus irregularis]|nr:13005_t:CDS:10 [Rhizophagus irregularis]
MVILNKTLWLLIMILLSLLPIFASEPPIALKTINNHEDLPNLHLDGSDTYNDGTIILLFTQKSTNKIINNTTIHLRIIFNDETIQSIEIDCSSQPDFIPRCKKSKDSDACSLNPKALIEGYVLIESVDKSERKKQIIVSWDKKIVSILELDEYKITVPHNSKQDFSIMELTNNKTLVWKKFTIDQNNASLKREDKTYNVPNDKTIIRNFFDPFSLVEGGYAAIIFMRTKLIHNKEFRNKNSIDEIYVIYFNDILPHQQFLLHSSSSEKSELLSLGLLRGGCVSFFDGSGYTYDFIESFNKIKSDQFLNSGSYNTFRIHFLSNGAVSLININLNITDNDFIATPLFYGGYIGQYSKKNDKSLIVLDNNNNIKNKLHLPFYDNIEHSKLKSFVMQKQLYIWFFNCSDDQTWNINYYSLNLINDYGTYLNDDVILRQRVSGRSDHCRLFNETAVSIKIFVSALHQTNVKYGIKVDDDFVKLQSNEEPLLGISERIWTFNISLETPDKPADQVSITSRLKLNKENYKKIDSIEDRKLLIQTLKNELRSTDSVLKDLDELIKKKKYNLLSNGNITRFLDTSYGANPLPDFWMTYGYHMIALGLLIVIVGCMIVFANYKYREGNNYSIIKIVIIIVDLVLDIMFIIMGIPEKPHLFVFSLLSVIIPIVFNTMMTTYSLIQEMIHNDDFNNWCKKHEHI